MTPENIVYVLHYYLAFWLFNSAAYGLVSIGMRRWLKFTHGLATEHTLRLRFRATLVFGAVRFTVGTIALILYANDTITALETIIVLGISSLLLNTVFIMGEGILLNRQAQAALDLPYDEQQLMRRAINQFASLERTVRNA